MLHKRISMKILVVIVMLSSACSKITPQPTGTPTLNRVATHAAKTATARATLYAQATTKARFTANARFTADAQLTAYVQATADASATDVVLHATGTAAANAKQSASATADALQATMVASDLYGLVQAIKEQGFIKSSEGTYYKLWDFDKSWAQINWYQWWDTSYSPTNFVIRTNAAWESAYTKADLFNSGCGFVFHAKDVDNHYMIFLAMDGYAYLIRYKNGVYSDLNKGYYGKLAIPADEAKLMLAVENGRITFFVNDKKVLRWFDNTIPTGILAYTLNSGTNKDWGTRCQMTNTELWVLR